MDIFCKIIEGEIPSYTCYENEYVKCIMDNSPVRPGHTLIIPKKHYTDIFEMDEKIMSEVHKTSLMLMKKMESTLPKCIGIKIVVNYGDEQKVKHYHMHVIPFYEENPNLSQEEICEMLKN